MNESYYLILEMNANDDDHTLEIQIFQSQGHSHEDIERIADKAMNYPEVTGFMIIPFDAIRFPFPLKQLEEALLKEDFGILDDENFGEEKGNEPTFW